MSDLPQSISTQQAFRAIDEKLTFIEDYAKQSPTNEDELQDLFSQGEDLLDAIDNWEYDAIQQMEKAEQEMFEDE